MVLRSVLKRCSTALRYGICLPGLLLSVDGECDFPPCSEDSVEFTEFQMLLSPFKFPRMVVGLF